MTHKRALRGRAPQRTRRFLPLMTSLLLAFERLVSHPGLASPPNASAGSRKTRPAGDRQAERRGRIPPKG
jgi:hypothetical protein